MLMTLVGVSLAGVMAWADEPKPADTPAAKLTAIQKEAKDAETALYKTLDELGDSKEAQKKVNDLFKEHEEKQTKRYEAALEIAKAEPKSDVAFDALEWMLTTPRVYYQSVGKSAIELVLEHHTMNPKIGKMMLMLGRFGPHESHENHKVATKLIHAVSEKNPDKTVRGQVAIVKAWKAKGDFERAEYRKQKDVDELATIADKAFEAVIAEFGECKLLGLGKKQTLAEVSKIELFELRNLRIGKTAPDIEGEDLDGVKFKLSDYRGKVVVIDFWGDW
jgi:hypothetical protein